MGSADVAQDMVERLGPLDRDEVDHPLYLTEVRMEPDDSVPGVRIWWWQLAVDEVRAVCPDCRMSPCWRHVSPYLERGSDSIMSAFETCAAGWAGDDCVHHTGAATTSGRGATVGSVCGPCVLAHYGASPPATVHGSSHQLSRCFACLGWGITDTCRAVDGDGWCGGEFGYVEWAAGIVCLACGEFASKCPQCDGAAYVG